MRKKISILGSTGSIGKNALDIIEKFPEQFELTAVSANKNIGEVIEQIRKFKPKYVCIGTEEGYKQIKNEFPNIKVFVGEEGLVEIGALDETDVLLTSVVGAVGIAATVEAVKRGKTIALANKETMVAAGKIINRLVDKHGATIVPVDSEHSAVFQSLQSGKSSEVSRVILTASGGPFRGYSAKQLESVTLEQALKHPKWKMGSKITIDSSTLVNKGLEVIEAHHLFRIDYSKIDVVVHPESIIHSMVEFKDRSVIAQLGNPDMRIPIQYAFTFPDRMENTNLEQLDLIKAGKLTFEKPDLEVFRGLKLAYDAGKIGESMPAVFNAANEEAVELLLNRKIEYTDIYKIIEKAMENHKVMQIETIGDVIEADKWAREFVRSGR